MTRGRLLALSLLLLAPAGCVPPDAGPARVFPDAADTQRIGTLRTDGAAVFRNARQASDGEAVYSGDRVSTGAASAARIDFVRGGFAELDEQTDPDFRLLREGVCLLIRILTGRMFVDSENACVEIEDPNLRVVLNSRVHWQAGRQRSTVTVLEGRIDVIWPAREVVPAGQQVVGLRTQIARPTPVSRVDLERVVAWRQGYFRRVRDRAESRVPAVTGLTEQEAIERLGAGGLRVGQVSRTASGRARPGTVVDQQPRAGATVGPRDAVDLVVEADRLRVPSVVGLSEKEAAQRLADLGLRVGRVRRVTTGKDRPGTVLDQRPRSGDAIDPRDPVDLVVEATGIRVPSVVGLSEKEAARRLADLGLRVGQVRRVATGKDRPGTVLDQRPRAGGTIDPQDPVDLVVEGR
jgi:hypothetical protein